MHWIKKFEMVDSVDDLKSSSSVRGIQMPNYEVLDARFSSALNRIILSFVSKEDQVWRNKKPKKRIVSFAEKTSFV